MELVPAVVCVDGSGTNALATVRSLGRRQVPVRVVALKGSRQLVSASRYCAAHIEIPDETALHPALQRLGEESGRRPVLFVDNDSMMRLLAPHAAALGRHFHVVEPVAHAARLTDKAFQLRTAEEAGIAVPRTWFPQTWEELREIDRQTAKRLIAKPVPGYTGIGAPAGFKALIGASAEALVAKARDFVGSPQQLLIQEYVEGTDAQIHVGLCYRARDKRSFVLSAKKLRQTQPGAGVMAVGRATDNPEVRDMTRRLAEAVDLRGVLSTEFKLDAVERRYYFIEWNPRPAYFQSLGWKSGFDLAYLAYCDHVDPARLPDAPPTGSSGHYWINLRADLQHLSAAPSLVLRPGTWAPYFGSKEWAVFAPDDPMPWVCAMTQLAALGPARLAYRLAGRLNRVQASRAG